MRIGTAEKLPPRPGHSARPRSHLSGRVLVRPQQLLPVDPDLGADLGRVRRVVEHPVRLRRPVVVRPRKFLRRRRIYHDTGSGLLEPHALAWHSARRRDGSDRGSHHRHADVPPARPLFRVGDAGVSVGDSLLHEYFGFQEVSLPMHRETSRGVICSSPIHAIYTLVAVGLLVISVIACILVENSRFGLALLAIRQNELAAEAAGIDARSLEDARTDRVRNDRGRRRRSLCLRSTGGDAGFRIRHAGLRATGGDDVVWRRGVAVGSGDRCGRSGAVVEIAGCLRRRLPARHSGCGLWRRGHRHHSGSAGWPVLDHSRSVLQTETSRAAAGAVPDRQCGHGTGDLRRRR